MKKHENASFLNAIFILLFAITVLLPIGISGQSIQQKNALAAHVSVQAAPARVRGMTPRRLAASTAALLALIGVVIGGLALARPNSRLGTASGRLGATVALVAGLIGVAVGGLLVATSTGGLGTGGGIAGAVVALVLGLIGLVLGWLALNRSRVSA